MKTKIISFGILAILVVMAGFGVNQLETSPQTTLSAATLQYATTAVRIGDKKISVELAVTDDQKSLGLGERASLAENTGMLFVFEPAQPAVFWMKDMKFSLDIIWIADGKIVDISQRLAVPKPDTRTEDLPTYSANIEVDYVLEVSAGQADGLKIGDRVEVIDSQSV